LVGSKKKKGKEKKKEEEKKNSPARSIWRVFDEIP